MSLGAALVAGCGEPPANNYADTIKITEDGFNTKKKRVEVRDELLFENQSGETIHLKSESDDMDLNIDKQLEAESAVRYQFDTTGIVTIRLAGDSAAANSDASELRVGVGTDP